MEKIYYAYLKCNLEKTGDSVVAENRYFAAQYFAAKKDIDIKNWIDIYTVYPDKDLDLYLYKTIELKYKNSLFEYKFNKERNLFQLINIEDPILSGLSHTFLTINNFISWRNYLLSADYQLAFK